MADFPYLPHTPDDAREMLDTIGVESVQELFADIPDTIQLRRQLDLPDPTAEYDVYRKMSGLAAKNQQPVSFLGAGIYDHIIPAIVPFVQSRSEFLTAYTPYQAEISQGILQAMFEYQTLACALTGMDVSNASLYDGASAATEACAMAVNSVRRARKILYSGTISPCTIAVLQTFFEHIDIELVEVSAPTGVLTIKDFNPHLSGSAAVLVQSPNRYGAIEDYTGFAEHIHASGAQFIISSNPVSLGILKSPGEWGADIAVGDGQSCGLAQNFGGPGVGFICATSRLMRKMPGRIVGQTTDVHGNRAFVLTLQAREQHIKRERATSNICTNQALAALGMAVYLAAMGPEGIADVARQNHSKACYLRTRLISIPGVELLHDHPFFNEFPIALPQSASETVESMIDEGYLAGVPLSDIEDGEDSALLVAVTEKRTRDEIDGFVDALGRILS
jgi:glycine dehydrogenase subunit 1